MNNDGETESLRRALIDDMKPEGPQVNHLGLTSDRQGLMAYASIKSSSYIDNSNSLNALAGAAFGVTERLFAGHPAPFHEHCGVTLKADTIQQARELNERVVKATRTMSEDQISSVKAAAGVILFQGLSQVLNTMTNIPANVNPPVFISSGVKLEVPPKYLKDRPASIEARIRQMRALSRLNLPIPKQLYEESFTDKRRNQNNGGFYSKRR